MTSTPGAARAGTTPPTHIVDATMFWAAHGGGVRRYLLAKHAWLAAQPGWRHTIAAPLAPDARAVGDGDFVAPLPSWPLPMSHGYRLTLSRRALGARLAALRPSLIEAGDPYRLPWACLDAAQQCGVPAVAFCHSNLEQMAALAAGPGLRRLVAPAVRRYAARLYREFDLVLAPSEAMRRHLLDWGVDRAVHQPLGVDTTVFHPSRASLAWRDSLGLPANTRLLVYAGRFAAEKHLDVLAAAVRRLGSRYVLLALGDGPRPPSGERVLVRPFVRRPEVLATVLASADAFVHAGDQETFGLGALEAMACGTPVVARAREGLAELVDDSVGMAVHLPGAEAFAQAVSALFNRDRIARAIAARRRAEANDWRAVLRLQAARYRAMISTSPATLRTPPQPATPAPDRLGSLGR